MAKPEHRDDEPQEPPSTEEEPSSESASEDGEVAKTSLTREGTSADHPPLPTGPVPPLPQAAPPVEDDGWDPVWDETAQAFYFYNRFTQVSTWTNPRVPNAPQQPTAPGVGNYDRIPDRAPGTDPPQPQAAQAQDYTGYNPAIHGDYDPNATYAKAANPPVDPADPSTASEADPSKIYTATGTFNRFTGKWQPNEINPENHNDENKSRRQMSAFFDVDAAANSHNGKSLKAERASKKLSKQELKAFREKRKERKEEKRRAWLRD